MSLREKELHALSDVDLIVAYVQSWETHEIGVDYFLAQEMERRGFRRRQNLTMECLQALLNR